MNPILLLTRNNLALTKRCVASLERQDIPVSVNIIDNGSTDGTVDWASDEGILLSANTRNEGVSFGWNLGLGTLFGFRNPHVLVVGNDTVLPSSFYRTLLSVDLPFVTGVAVDNMEQANQPATVMPLEPYPDFSAFVIRRECWEKVGPFDQRLKCYVQDCDFHIRAHRKGIPLFKAAVPFYHERSSTLRLAPPDEQLEIAAQADKDRQEFSKMYHCLPGTSDYENLFK